MNIFKLNWRTCYTEANESWQNIWIAYPHAEPHAHWPHSIARYLTAWHNTTRHGTLPHGMARNHTACLARHGTVPYSIARYRTAWNSTSRHDRVWHGTVPHGMARCHTAWHGTTRHDTAWHSATRHGTLPHGMARYHTACHESHNVVVIVCCWWLIHDPMRNTNIVIFYTSILTYSSIFIISLCDLTNIELIDMQAVIHDRWPYGIKVQLCHCW